MIENTSQSCDIYKRGINFKRVSIYAFSLVTNLIVRNVNTYDW